MADAQGSRATFSEWIARPQALIALAALILSVCGLFIAIYEASLIRRSQRAAAWPHVRIGASIEKGDISLWVRNVGVGPARIRSAAITHNGEVQADWNGLLESLLGENSERVSGSFSLINGVVLGAGSDGETIFSLAAAHQTPDSRAIPQLGRGLTDGSVDIEVCYCSVYEDCWTANLQAIMSRASAAKPPPAAVEVESCDAAHRSGI